MKLSKNAKIALGVGGAAAGLGLVYLMTKGKKGGGTGSTRPPVPKPKPKPTTVLKPLAPLAPVPQNVRINMRKWLSKATYLLSKGRFKTARRVIPYEVRKTSAYKSLYRKWKRYWDARIAAEKAKMSATHAATTAVHHAASAAQHATSAATSAAQHLTSALSHAIRPGSRPSSHTVQKKYYQYHTHGRNIKVNPTREDGSKKITLKGKGDYVTVENTSNRVITVVATARKPGSSYIYHQRPFSLSPGAGVTIKNAGWGTKNTSGFAKNKHGMWRWWTKRATYVDVTIIPRKKSYPMFGEVTEEVEPVGEDDMGNTVFSNGDGTYYIMGEDGYYTSVPEDELDFVAYDEDDEVELEEVEEETFAGEEEESSVEGPEPPASDE